MEANVITLGRILLIFITVGLFEIPWIWGKAIATVLVAITIYLDALDGYVARKLGVSSDIGALFDIVGDRIVEAVLWIYFSATGLITFWAPLIIVTRGFLTDSVRTVAFGKGHTPFGEKTMMRSPVTRFLVSSRFSRGLYGGLKTVLFVYMGFLVFFDAAISQFTWPVSSSVLNILTIIATILAVLTVILCVVRGIPVLVDGKNILFEKMYPKDMN